MKKIGSTLMILGVLAIVLNFANRVPTVLMWIYNWGDTVAMIIKVSAIALGAVLYFASKNGEEKSNG